MIENNEKVISRVIKLQDINWRELQFIQDKNFKAWEQQDKTRLKASIVGNNFSDPFKVWEDEQGVIWCLDGRHRTYLLEELHNEGILVPYMLPANFIACENKKQAAKLVLLYSSNYATITPEGLTAFNETHELDWSLLKNEVSLSDFSIAKFEQHIDFYKTEQTYNETERDNLEEFLATDKPILVKNGDLFRLGNNYLICGDFQKQEILDTLFAIATKLGIVITQLQTDPPYNLPANEITNKGEVKHEDFAFGGGEMADEQFKDFTKNIMETAIKYTCDGALHYIWIDFRHVWHFTQAAHESYLEMQKTKRHAYEPKQILVWKKMNAGNGSFYRAMHELCFIFKNGTAKHISHLDLGNRYRTNVLEYPNASSFANPDRDLLKEHPTPKPLQMIADLLLDTTNEGDGVIDFFGGTGTTLVACEQTNRHCFMTEIMPNYCQVIIRRYLNHCKRNNIAVQFEHLNGVLRVEDF